MCLQKTRSRDAKPRVSHLVADVAKQIIGVAVSTEPIVRESKLLCLTPPRRVFQVAANQNLATGHARFLIYGDSHGLPLSQQYRCRALDVPGGSGTREG